MDKALGTVQPELPAIFNMVKGYISFRKGFNTLVTSKLHTSQCEQLNNEFAKLIKDLCIHHKVDIGIVTGFDELIKKESKNPQ